MCAVRSGVDWISESRSGWASPILPARRSGAVAGAVRTGRRDGATLIRSRVTKRSATFRIWWSVSAGSGFREHERRSEQGGVKVTDEFFSREDRYSLGRVDGTDQLFLSIPVSNGLVDYEEFYELSRREYERFLADPKEAARFAEQCRRHTEDDRLIQKPGWNRGTPA